MQEGRPALLMRPEAGRCPLAPAVELADGAAAPGHCSQATAAESLKEGHLGDTLAVQPGMGAAQASPLQSVTPKGWLTFL